MKWTEIFHDNDSESKTSNYSMGHDSNDDGEISRHESGRDLLDDRYEIKLEMENMGQSDDRFWKGSEEEANIFGKEMIVEKKRRGRKPRHLRV